MLPYQDVQIHPFLTAWNLSFWQGCGIFHLVCQCCPRLDFGSDF